VAVPERQRFPSGRPPLGTMSKMPSTSTAPTEADDAAVAASEAKAQTVAAAAVPACSDSSNDDNGGRSSNSSGAVVTGARGVGPEGESGQQVAAVSPTAVPTTSTAKTTTTTTSGGGGDRRNTGGEIATTAVSAATATATGTATTMSHIAGAAASDGGAPTQPAAAGTARAAGAANTERGGEGEAGAAAHVDATASSSSLFPKAADAAVITTDDAAAYEETHVHSVYESIAPHFSATRYKPWPVIAAFLDSQPPGALGLDVGCGNGKYLAVNRACHVVGSDRSANLVRIARDHGGVPCGQDVAVADGLSLPFVRGRADFVICVAVIHHMSTRRRRQDAVRALLECVVPADKGGRVLVYVWALEQANSRRGWDEGADQDQLVPWVFRAKKEKKKPKDGTADGEKEGSADSESGDTTYQRYYHLFKKEELEEDVVAAGGKVEDHGYDKDNWWVIASRVD
jgi:tRNA (uracil-5-)-methyltransferase TRM9